MAAPRGGTKERLLDAAEQLYALKGFEGTSNRDVADRAGDTAGSIHYHFGSKEELLNAVISRRWEDVSRERRDAYAAIKAHSRKPPTIEQVLDCIVSPFLERALTDEGWRSYTLLVIARRLDPTVARLRELAATELMGWMQEALPKATRHDIAMALQFVVGSMIETLLNATNGAGAKATGGAFNSSDLKTIKTALIAYSGAGVRAITKSR